MKNLIQKAMQAALKAHMARGEAMAEEARELAEKTAEERGVGIEDVCVVASPFGKMRAVVRD